MLPLFNSLSNLIEKETLGSLEGRTSCYYIINKFNLTVHENSFIQQKYIKSLLCARH